MTDLQFLVLLGDDTFMGSPHNYSALTMPALLNCFHTAQNYGSMHNVHRLRTYQYNLWNGCHPAAYLWWLQILPQLRPAAAKKAL